MSTPDFPTALAEELVATIHFLHQRGWAPATSSNYSLRSPGASDFYVSASGIDKGAFGLQHLLHVDAAGNPRADPRRPSAETALHAMVYALFPHVHCVLHTHSVYNTILSEHYLAAGALTWSNYELLKGFEGINTHAVSVKIPIFANTQDIPALAAAVRAYPEPFPAFLIAGHGLYTWGSSIAAARRHVEVAEFLLECTYRKLTLGSR